MENRSPSLGTMFIYSLPLLGGGAINFFLSSYIMKYSTDVLLIPPVVVGFLFAFSRIWDAVSDPICGHLSDTTVSPIGRRRVWLLYSVIPLWISFSALWYAPSDNVVFKSIWFGFWLFILFTALTMFYVPHYSLGSEICKSDKDRAKVFGIRSIFENSGTIAAALLLGTLAGFSEWMYSHVKFMSMTGFITIILIILTVTFTKEKKNTRANLPLVHSIKAVWKNREARAMLSISFCTQSGATLLLSSALYFSKYVLNNEQAGSHIAALFLITAILSVPVWIALSLRLGKQKALFTGLLILTIVFIPVFLVKFGLPEISIYPLSVVLGLAAGAILTLQPAALSAVAELEEKKSGHRNDGIIFAVFTFINKSAMAFAALLLGAVLEITAFTPNAIQEYPAQMGIRIVFTVLPLVFFGTASFIQYKSGLISGPGDPFPEK